MKKIFWALIFTLILFVSNASAYTGLCCGKCGGNMPLNIPGGGCPETHEFRFKLSYMYMNMDGLRDGTDNLSSSELLGMPSMGGFMAVPTDMDMRMINLAAGYSFTDDLFGGLMMMYRSNDMGMKFNSMMSSMTGRDGFDMESEGMGDTMLMAKYRLYYDDPLLPKSQVSAFLGLNLPTGSIDEKNDKHPVGFRKGEQLPYSMQLGSGTFDPTLGLLYQGSVSPWWWGSNLMYTGRFYDNDRDYRLGDEATLDLYSMYQVRYDLLLELQLNGRWSDKIGGEMDESRDGSSGHVVQGDPTSPVMTPLWDTDNYGGTKLGLTAGVQWQPVPFHILNLQFGVPVYQDLNGPQLEEDYRLMFTWYWELPTSASVRYASTNGGKKSALGFDS